MKKMIVCLSVLAVLVGVACLAATPPNKLSAAPSVEEKAPFEGWNKLDLKTRQIYKKDPTSKEWSDVIIKVSKVLSPKQMKQLKKAGFKPGAEINTIITGKIQMIRLPDLVALNLVEYVEAAIPLGLKKK